MELFFVSTVRSPSEVGGQGVQGGVAVAVGGLGDGGDLLLALLEFRLRPVGVGLRLVGRRPGLAEGDVRGVEVLAGHLGGLRGALGLGADLREADLDLGDRELRGLLGRLRLGDVVFGWGRLGHLGDRERRYGRQRRESEADPASLLGKCLH